VKKLNKATLARLQSAFTYAQHRSKTSYHFTFQGLSAKDMAEEHGSEEAILGFDETNRGEEDENHFLISVNVDRIGARSMRLLRLDAGHEVLHAITYKLFKSNTMTNWENAVYILQRALYGEDDD
jgi:hypothetical protein